MQDFWKNTHNTMKQVNVHELTKLDEISEKDQVKVSKSQSLTSKIKAKFVNFVNYAMRIFNSVWCMVYGVCTDEGTYSPRVLSRITPTCIGNDQVMTPRLPRLDSVSIPSRCRVLAKYVASLALFLCLGVGL